MGGNRYRAVFFTILGQAELVPAKLVFNNTFILCDQRVEPKYRCCLPNGPHLACYNIM